MVNSTQLPPGWTVGEEVPTDDIYTDPPESSDPTRINLYGLAEDDPSHRLYSLSADTPVADVVRHFKVGAQSELSYGDDPEETNALVAEIATRIAAMVPCKPIFADSAGLKLRFLRQVTPEDLVRIEALFPEDQMMQAGLERYGSEWDGESPLLAPVLEENVIHFWWD